LRDSTNVLRVVKRADGGAIWPVFRDGRRFPNPKPYRQTVKSTRRNRWALMATMTVLADMNTPP